MRGFVQHKPVWQIRPLTIEVTRGQAQVMEAETQRFYRLAAARSTDASIRKLLGDLADAEASTNSPPTGWSRRTCRRTSRGRSRKRSGGCSCCG